MSTDRCFLVAEALRLVRCHVSLDEWDEPIPGLPVSAALRALRADGNRVAGVAALVASGNLRVVDGWSASPYSGRRRRTRIVTCD